MEPLLIILVPGLLGGIAIALLVVHRRIGFGTPADGRRLEPPSPGLINMAHIRVEGLGGLGMVAMAITVAIFVPRIRFTMAIALLLGAALAAVLVALRRRAGPLPSGGSHPGAYSILGLDGPQQLGRRATSPHSTAKDDQRTGSSRALAAHRSQSGVSPRLAART